MPLSPYFHQVALRAAYVRNLKADPDGVVDPVMRQAFANFSHDEVERLPGFGDSLRNVE